MELEILRYVYEQEFYPDVTPSEKPDFIVNADEPFGVEVTEFFVDEVSARLNKRPGYSEDIIAGKNVHKSDDKLTEKIKYKVTKKSGTAVPGSVTAIAQINPPITDSLAMLVAKINKKTRKLAEYDTSVGPIDLIIYDPRAILLDGTNDHITLQTFRNLQTSHAQFLPYGYRHIYIAVISNEGKSQEIFRLR